MNTTAAPLSLKTPPYLGFDRALSRTSLLFFGFSSHTAPAARSAATTSVCPFFAAMMSGVAPSVRAEEKGGHPARRGTRAASRESNEMGEVREKGEGG